MTEIAADEKGSGWAKFIAKHWMAFAVFMAAGILAVAGSVYVFVWFTGNAQSIALVPSTLGAWSMNDFVLFILHAIFWELVLIGIPVAVGAIIGWIWWKKLPSEETYHLSGKKGSKSNRAGGAISPLLFIAFAIKVYVDGNWTLAFSSYTLDYVVGSMVTILIWIAAIFAIPAIVGIVWWVHHERTKNLFP